MKPHVWEVEEVDVGHLGVGEFWICRGYDVFSDDCEEAAHQVAQILAEAEADE